MNIKQALEQQHNKIQNKRITDYIGNDKTRFVELVELFLGNNKIVAQRAAWAISDCGLHFPELIIPYQSPFLNKLMEENTHDAIKRNILRTWVHQMPPEDIWGALFDRCYHLARSKDQPRAIKAFSLYIMGNIACHYAELAHEVRILIEDLKPLGTPGIQASSKKVLKQLQKV
jgi:hypothetical protein